LVYGEGDQSLNQSNFHLLRKRPLVCRKCKQGEALPQAFTLMSRAETRSEE